MFLGTDTSLRWRRRFWVALVLLVASYVWHAWGTDFPHGGSRVGQVYGYTAFGLILILILFALRKRAYKSRLGTLEGWAQVHSYLGLLVVAVVLFHSGFRFQDKLALSAFAVMTLVSVSGLVGAVLYTMLPRILTAVGTEPDVPEIAGQLNQLRKNMLRLVEGKSRALVEVHDHLAKEARPMTLAGWRIMSRNVARPTRDEKLKQYLKAVEDKEEPDLKRLLVMSRQQNELHRLLVSQQRYRNLLQVWLYFHVPLSVALVALVVAHLVAVYYYT